jgi:hypothetical protein
MKHKFVKDHVSDEDMTFEVIGAGTIKLGGSASCACGGRVGFHFGVSWSEYGVDCGGVLNRVEAKKLADRIYEVLNSCTDTEAECYANMLKSIRFDSQQEFRTGDDNVVLSSDFRE